MSDVAARLSAALADTYRIEDRVGEGGMATVYLAEDVKHGRKVAVKVLHPQLAATLGVERFLREIQTTAGLRHPNILPLFDSGHIPADGADPAMLYYVMPFAEGATLRDRLAAEKQLPIDDALQIARDVAGALSYAHGHGVIHRDVKPENILLESGRAVVADFGIACAVDAAGGERMTATGIAVGTPGYMSPEQAAASPDLDGRSDLYSLAGVTYEMLTGRTPHSASTPQALMAKVLTETPDAASRFRPGLPRAVDTALSRALALSPEDRFASTAEFAAALMSASVPGGGPAARFSARAAAAGVASVLGVVAAVWLMRDGAPAPASRLAVVPFTPVGEATDEFFADGVSELITSELASLGGLRVVSRTSAARFRGSDLPLDEVGVQLEADYILAGTVRTASEADGRRRVRVTPVLVRVADNVEVWSEPYSAAVAEEIFATQEEIATAVARAMNVALTPVGASASPRAITRDDAALDAYLLGRYLLRRRDAASLLAAADNFRTAIARDSGFAPAWAGLSDAVMLHHLHYASGTGSAAYERALDAASRAVALDSTSADAWASLALGRTYGRWDWAGGDAAYRRALALDPDHATAHIWFGELLWIRGDLDRAIEQLELAVRADPLSAVAHNVLAEIAWLRVDGPGPALDSIVQRKHRARELEPGWGSPLFALGLILSPHEPDSAATYAARIFEMGDMDAARAHHYGRACVGAWGRGDPAAADTCLEGWERLSPGDVAGPAFVYAAAHDADRLFAIVDAGLRQRDATVVLFLRHLERMFGPDERFAAVRARMGL